MKKIIFLVLIIVCFSVSLYSQTGDNYNKIVQLFKENNFQEVVTEAQVYLKSFPASENAKKVKLYMGISYIRLKENDMAIQVFEEHNSDYPDFEKNEQVKYLVGKLYYDKGDYMKSKAVLNEQLKKYPGGEYALKAAEILKSIESKSKQQKLPELKQASRESPSARTTYSFTKITWTKIASATCLVASPVFFLMGNNYETKADDTYNNNYMKATTAADATSSYNQVDDYAQKSATFKNASWISLAAGVSFFAVDFFFTGRIAVSATDKRVSLHYQF